MSAVPTELDVFGESPEPSPSGGRRLSTAATAYLAAIAIAAGLVALPFLSRLQTADYSVATWLAFVLFAAGAALAQVALVKTPHNQSYHATNVFLIPAILLLPPELVIVVAIVQHIPAWLKNRTAWYREFFNICNYVIATIAAWGAVHGILHADGLIPNVDLRFAIAGAACSIVLVGLNHAMLAPMLLLGHGHSIRESGLFSFHGLSTELVLAALGVVVATFWHARPVADPVRGGARPADPPLARGPAARGRGPRRPEDRPLQRAPLRARAERGDRARPALRPAAGVDHGRPRPPARHQQLVRPSRRRCGAEGHRRGLPHAPAPLRRPGALRRRRVQHPPAGDERRGGARDRGAHPQGGLRAHLRRRDFEPADPRDGLDRRRRVSARRERRERADPPGRPRRLPREAPGPEPGARRHLRAPGRAERPQASPRGGARVGRPHGAAAACGRGDSSGGAPASADARDARAPLPLAVRAPRAPRRPRGVRRASRPASSGSSSAPATTCSH